MVRLCPAHADDSKEDEESLSAAGLEGALFGLTNGIVVVVFMVGKEESSE